MKHMKVTVIGGGLSGLAAAALLAKAGNQVRLLEKNSSLGGRASTFTKKGFLFDRGPSWYMMPEVFDDFYGLFGKKTSDFYSLAQLNPKYRVYNQPKTYVDISSQLNKNYQLFESYETGSSTKLEQLLEKSSKVYDISLKLLYDYYHSPLDLLNPKSILNGLDILRTFNPFVSYHHHIQNYISDPFLQQLLEFHTVFMGGSPHNTPALYSILLAADFMRPVEHPIGGFGEIVKALESLCLEHGVHIMCDQPVTSLELRDGHITAVKSGKKSYPTDIVLNSADYAYFDTQLLPEKYQEYSPNHWQRQEYAISSLLLYLGVSKKLSSVAHHTFYFQPDWNSHFNDIYTHKKLPKNPSFYLSTTSHTDPSTAPQGQENVFALIPISVDSPEATTPSYITHVLEHIETVLGEKFRDQIVVKEVFGQKGFSSLFNAYKGNALGLAHTLKQSVFMRPRMKSSKVANLYHSGHFTQPGVGVPMAIISAQLATNLIHKHNNHS